MRTGGSYVALVTPFEGNAGNSVSEAVLEQLVRFHANGGTDGIVVAGTTGEASTLTLSEWESAIKIIKEQTAGLSMSVVAGSGSNNTLEAVRRTEKAAELGVDACLIVTPYYNRPSPPGLVAHFRELNSIGVPLIIYDIPGRTGVKLAPATFREIVSTCQNTVGVKVSSGDLNQITAMAEIGESLDRPFAMFSGDDALTLPIIAVGGCGVISVAANVIPEVMKELVTAAALTDLSRARKLAYQLNGFCNALLEVGSSPAAVKTILRVMGIPVGNPRLPIVDLTLEQTDTIVAITRRMRESLSASGVTLNQAVANI